MSCNDGHQIKEREKNFVEGQGTVKQGTFYHVTIQTTVIWFLRYKYF